MALLAFQAIFVTSTWLLAAANSAALNTKGGGVYKDLLKSKGTPTLGPTFLGIGAVSGGGATSRLLIDYTEEQRSRILDLLFLPKGGASLHGLKVEIGCDAFTTNGAEATHKRSKADEDFSRGYEWWLMKEATKRNPKIRLEGLPWCFPGYLGENNLIENPEGTAEYVTAWVRGAKEVHGLHIDAVGLHNERKFSAEYIKALRAQLDAAGLQTTDIVAADSGWDDVSQAILHDVKLAQVVDVVNAHYPGKASTPAALRTGKPIIDGEDGSTRNDMSGAGCLGRVLNQNFVEGSMISSWVWNLASAYYPGLPYPKVGLINSFEPWSGHFEVSPQLWAVAHTTQFAMPGWQYLTDSKFSKKLSRGGSVVTLQNPKDTSEFSIVVEKMSYKHSQCVRPPLAPYDTASEDLELDLPQDTRNPVHVWRSCFTFDGENIQMTSPNHFEHVSTLQPDAGKSKITLRVDEDCMYSLTTTTGQQKATSLSPLSQPFPEKFSDNFESYETNQAPKYWSTMSGAFEIFQGSSSNKVMRQTTPQRPQTWEKDLMPVSLFGDHDWLNTSIEARLFLEPDEDQGAFIGVRSMWSPSSYQDKSGCGVYLVVAPTGSWHLYGRIEDIHSGSRIIQQGKIPGASPSGKWMKLLLQVEDDRARGWHNNVLLFDITGSKVPMCPGWAAIGTTEYRPAQFDDITVRAGQAVQDFPVNAKVDSKLKQPQLQKVHIPQAAKTDTHRKQEFLPSTHSNQEHSVPASKPLIRPAQESKVKETIVNTPSIRPHVEVPSVSKESQSGSKTKTIPPSDTSDADSLTIFRAFFCLLTCCIVAAVVLAMWQYVRTGSEQDEIGKLSKKWWENDELSGLQQKPHGINAYQKFKQSRRR
jgi:galactosylceramidase